MGRFDERLRRLERQFRDRGPSLAEVGAAFQRLAVGARAKLRGESVDEEQRARDHDTVIRWEKASGVDLSQIEEKAGERLRRLGPAQK